MIGSSDGDQDSRRAGLRPDGRRASRRCARRRATRRSSARSNERVPREGARRASRSSSTTASRRARSPPRRSDTTLGNLSGTTKLDDLKDCDLVIEAIVENVDEKREDLRRARRRSSAPHTIFCSNTSSLCITELAATTKRPDRFAGLHFFNPVPLMKLVEVIRALTTSDETYQTVFAFAQSLGKEPITAPDKPGLHRQPPARAVPARRDPRLRERPRHARGHRQGHEARLRLSDGPVHAARLRRPRHDLLHRQHHVRGVSASRRTRRRRC